MRTKILFLALLIAMPLTFSAPQIERGWRHIVPLNSTRSQVERILGASENECKCFYRVDDFSVHVDYALAPCKGVVPGWNVATDTVLRFTIRPTVQQQRFEEMKLDLAKYSLRHDDTFTTYYANRSGGIEYAVSSDGLVSSISYIPSSDDDHLRCNGFPQEDGSLTDHISFDEYGDLDFGTETGRLDNLAIALYRNPKFKAYIVVYAGEVACPHEARSRALRARAYLINKYGVSAARVSAIDGGHREQFLVRLYAVPQVDDPPTIVPTIASNEVKPIRNRRCVSFR